MTLAITMGDPSGIGPEILLRRWVGEGGLGDDVVVYGDAAVLHHGAGLLGLDIDWATFPLVDLGLLSAADHRPGQLDRASGAAARAYVERATLDALAGKVAGIVTMPMNKEATQLSDPTFVGHTEFIAGLCGVQKVTMMLTAATPSGSIAVTHVSTHCSLGGDPPGHHGPRAGRGAPHPRCACPVPAPAAHRSVRAEPARGGARPLRP